jgi:hypothetical protein
VLQRPNGDVSDLFSVYRSRFLWGPQITGMETTLIRMPGFAALFEPPSGGDRQPLQNRGAITAARWPRPAARRPSSPSLSRTLLLEIAGLSGTIGQAWKCFISSTPQPAEMRRIACGPVLLSHWLLETARGSLASRMPRQRNRFESVFAERPRGVPGPTAKVCESSSAGTRLVGSGRSSIGSRRLRYRHGTLGRSS